VIASGIIGTGGKRVGRGKKTKRKLSTQGLGGRVEFLEERRQKSKGVGAQKRGEVEKGEESTSHRKEEEIRGVGGF